MKDSAAYISFLVICFVSQIAIAQAPLLADVDTYLDGACFLVQDRVDEGDGSLEGPSRMSVGRQFGFLTEADLRNIRFVCIKFDPEVGGVCNGEHRGAWLHVHPFLSRLLKDNAGHRRKDCHMV